MNEHKVYHVGDQAWYQEDCKPGVQDTWNTPEVASLFVNQLLDTGIVGIANNLTGVLCLILDCLGIEYTVWYPKYIVSFGAYAPLSNFNQVRLENRKEG